MNKFSKEQIVTALVDCFGYGAEEFEGVRRSVIISCMTDAQLAEVRSYLA